MVSNLDVRVLYDSTNNDKFDKFIQEQTQKLADKQDYIAISIPSLDIYDITFYDKKSNNDIVRDNNIQDNNIVHNNIQTDTKYITEEFDLSGIVNSTGDDDIYT